MMKRMMTLLVAATFLVVGAISAQAFSLDFYRVDEANGTPNIEGQLTLDITLAGSDAGVNTFAFKFGNAGVADPVPSSIESIYFGMDPYFGNLLEWDSFEYSAFGYVLFDSPATPPEPGGGISWASSYDIDADNSTGSPGVDPYEWMIVNFTGTLSLGELATAFANDLVVGMHVQSILGEPFIGDDDNFSDWFITRSPETPIPEPATLLLLGSGLAGVAAWRRRKKA